MVNDDNNTQASYKTKSSAQHLAESLRKFTKLGTDFVSRGSGFKQQNKQKSSFYSEKQQELRKAYLKFAEKKEGINQAYIERINNIDQYFSEGLISYPQYYAMLNQVISSMEEMEKTSAMSTKEANIKVNEESKKIEDNSQQIINEIDPHLKKRLLLLFLIAAPFLPIPYLDFIADPLSQIFDPTQTMGESMSEMVKSESLGKFGELMDVAQVDELVRLFFDETPILGELFGAVDKIAGSNLVYGSATLLSPMILESPVAYLAISAASGVYLTDKELAIQEKIKAITESSQKSIEKLGKELKKNFDEKFTENAKKHGQEMFKAWKTACMVDEIIKIKDFIPNPATSEFKELFEGIPGLDNLKTLKDDDLCPFLFSLDEGNFKKFFDKTLLFYDSQMRIIKSGNPVTDIHKEALKKIKALKGEAKGEVEKIIIKKLNDAFEESFADKTIDYLIEAKKHEIAMCQEKEKREHSFFGSADTFSTKQHINDCQRDINNLYNLMDIADNKNSETVKSYYENYARDKILRNASHCRVLGDIVPRYCDVGRGKPMQLDEDLKIDSPKAKIERNEIGNRVSWAKRIKDGSRGGGPDLSNFFKGGGL
ncbi:MAG: hypothetical protein RL769_487 [Pseudomonadota bacterium]|jgi:hypothetical protein